MKTKHTVEWTHECDSIDIVEQAQMVIDDMDTDREWQAIGINDDEGVGEVVALCHPINAPLISSAPALLSECQRLLTLLEGRNGEITQTPEAIAQLRDVVIKAGGVNG